MASASGSKRLPKANQFYLQLLSFPMSNIQQLNSLATKAIQNNDLQSAEDYLEQALRLDPRSLYSLSQRARMRLKEENFDGALEDYETWIAIDPSSIEARSQIRFIHRQLIGAWHFEMMNDVRRNAAYQKAIEAVVFPGATVLDIGAGSGLLSLMAARAGAGHVYACEKSRPTARVAREIIKKNGFQNSINVIESWSTALEIGREIPEKVDIIIGEVFDPGLIGELGLHYLADAANRLLKPNGRMIPESATMHGQLVESTDVARLAIVKEVSGFDVSAFQKLYDDPALQLDMAKFNHRYLTDEFIIDEVRFGDEYPIDTSLGKKSVAVTQSGTAHALVQWFTLKLADNCYFDTSPRSPRTHWEQHVQIFEKGIALKEGQLVELDGFRYEERYSLKICS